MSIEAPAGKNPLDHTGKLYGVLSQQLAEQISQLIDRPVETHIFTSKEARLDSPDEVTVRIDGPDLTADQERAVRELIAARLAAIGDITRQLIFDGIEMW
jgi:S-adenosylmethionine synthetase